MKTPQILIVCLALVLGYVAAIALNRPSSARTLPAPQPLDQDVVVGRF
jgi:hypothetical protein